MLGATCDMWSGRKVGRLVKEQLHKFEGVGEETGVVFWRGKDPMRSGYFFRWAICSPMSTLQVLTHIHSFTINLRFSSLFKLSSIPKTELKV